MGATTTGRQVCGTRPGRCEARFVALALGLLCGCTCRRDALPLWPSADAGLEEAFFRTRDGELVSVFRAVYRDGCQFSNSDDGPLDEVPCDGRWTARGGTLEVRCTCDPRGDVLHWTFGEEREERGPTLEELGFEVDGGVRTMRLRDVCFVGPLDGGLQRVECDAGCDCDPSAKSEKTVTCSGFEPGTQYRDIVRLDGERSSMWSVQGCMIWESKVELLDGGVLRPERPALARTLVLRGTGSRRTLRKELPRDGGWVWSEVELTCWTEAQRVLSGP